MNTEQCSGYHKNNPEAFLWVRTDTKKPYKHITYELITRMIKDCAEKASVTKKINCHAFRHARATNLANSLTDRQMKEFFGWRKSETISTYTHLSGKDIDEAILKQHGIIINNNGKSNFTLKVCEKCNAQNDPVVMFCKECRHPIDAEEKRKAFMDTLYGFMGIIAEENPKIKEKFRDHVKKNKLEWLFEQ